MNPIADAQRAQRHRDDAARLTDKLQRALPAIRDEHAKSLAYGRELAASDRLTPDGRAALAGEDRQRREARIAGLLGTALADAEALAAHRATYHRDAVLGRVGFPDPQQELLVRQRLRDAATRDLEARIPDADAATLALIAGECRRREEAGDDAARRLQATIAAARATVALPAIDVAAGAALDALATRAGYVRLALDALASGGEDVSVRREAQDQWRGEPAVGHYITHPDGRLSPAA